MKQPLLIILFLLWAGNASVLTQSPVEGAQPLRQTVFMLGQNEDQYTEIIRDYPANLLSVSGDSMEKAYEHWMQLMLDMEDHAEKMGFDLKGLKIWINVFWNREGQIDYITYYPKPNCKNIPFDTLTAFFKDFIRDYQSGISTQLNYSHYGSASFPSFAEMFLQDKE
jgi:hypothetical protein